MNSIYNDLRPLVGNAGLLAEGQYGDYQVDGLPPKAVALPESVGEIADVLNYAANHQLSVIPAGSGTKLRVGNPPEKVDLVLSTLRLNRVLDYEPADLTVTVEAGIRLSDLQSMLAEHGQYLPIDPAFADRATIGGMAATNASGPSRLRFGATRDLILGIHVVLADGTEIKSGGRVMKNVAGYDLTKLFIGSYGTLGIITQVSFKLQPLPEVERLIALTFKGVSDGCQAGLKIAGSQLLPSYLALFANGIPGENAAEPILLVGLAGHLETVEWQVGQLEEAAKQSGAVGVRIYEGEARSHLETSMCSFSEAPWAQRSVVCRANLRRTTIEGFIASAQKMGAGLDLPMHTMALVGNGVVYVVFSEVSDAPPLVSALTQLREAARHAEGNLIVETAPVEIKRRIDVWGDGGTSLALMKKVKAELDGGGLLNPGRFVGGI